MSELSAPQSFKTHEAAPTVLSESAFNEEEGRGRFTAVINPNHSKQETTYYFEYSTDKEAVEKKEGAQAAGTGTIAAEEFGEDPATSVITTLATAQVPVEATYYYRIVATNETGTTYGEIEAYTKLPLIENESFSGLTSINAKLEATVYPNFQETTYGFEYSTNETLLKEGKGTLVHGGTLPANEEPISPIAVTVEAVSLQPGQTYYYRAIAENKTSKYTKNANEGKLAGGLIQHFTTPAGPAATTGEAQNITRTSATLSGAVNPDGTETTYSFQYISETAYQAALAKHITDPYTEGETTVPASAGSGEATMAAGPTQASGLRPEETYRYRLVATNKYGVQGIGKDATFTTTTATPPSAVTGSATGISQNTATLSGTVATNGLQTSYAFEIGTEPGNLRAPDRRGEHRRGTRANRLRDPRRTAARHDLLLPRHSNQRRRHRAERTRHVRDTRVPQPARGPGLPTADRDTGRRVPDRRHGIRDTQHQDETEGQAQDQGAEAQGRAEAVPPPAPQEPREMRTAGPRQIRRGEEEEVEGAADKRVSERGLYDVNVIDLWHNRHRCGSFVEIYSRPTRRSRLTG